MDSGGHREIELKRRLMGDRAAERLMNALGKTVSPPRQQVNHVFDTDNRALQRTFHALRLRIEPKGTFLTAKGPDRAIGRSGGARVEAEALLEPELAQRILSGEVQPIEVLKSRLADRGYEELWSSLEAACAGWPLKPIGHFENERRTAPMMLPSRVSLILEIDRTRFPGGRVDEEVELEVPTEDLATEAEAWLHDVLARAGVTSTESTPKIARFYEAIATESPP